MKILLVSTYELGHQPLGLAWPRGFLEAAGFPSSDITTCDLAISSLDEDSARSADFIGISVPMHTALRLGMQAATQVRALNSKCHICFYGLYAPLNREHLLANDGNASVVGGESEEELVEAVRAVARGERPKMRMAVLDRLHFPIPRRDGLQPLDRYASFISDGRSQVAGYVEASRGCLHHCRHCPIPAVYHGRFFVVPIETVLADVAQQAAAGARHITLGDADFLNGPNHAMAVVRAIHAAHPTLTFDVTIKIEHILKHGSFFPELAALGCAFIVSAVESLSDRVLAILDKGHTRADVDEAIDLLEAAGIPLRPSLVSFTPWTAMEDYLGVLDWIERRGLYAHVDPIQLAIRLLIPPGSLLLDLPEVRSILGPLDEARFSYQWTHPDPQMEILSTEVFALVSRREGEPPERVIAEVSALARSMASGKTVPITHPPSVRSVPRLSESWFCCAEPNERQLEGHRSNKDIVRGEDSRPR